MDTSIKKAKGSLIEDKLKKIIFGGKSPKQTLKSENSIDLIENQSINETSMIKK